MIVLLRICRVTFGKNFVNTTVIFAEYAEFAKMNICSSLAFATIISKN